MANDDSKDLAAVPSRRVLSASVMDLIEKCGLLAVAVLPSPSSRLFDLRTR